MLLKKLLLLIFTAISLKCVYEYMCVYRQNLNVIFFKLEKSSLALSPIVSAFNTLLAHPHSNHPVSANSSTLLNELICAQHLEQCLAQKCFKVVAVVTVTQEETSPSPKRG